MAQDAPRAEYGKGLLKELAAKLTIDFGKGFDERELRKMRQFYQTFQKRDTLRHELTWSHYRRLISVEDEKARLWYMNEGKQLFASRYKLYLPTEEEFKHMLEVLALASHVCWQKRVRWISSMIRTVTSLRQSSAGPICRPILYHSLLSLMTNLRILWRKLWRKCGD